MREGCRPLITYLFDLRSATACGTYTCPCPDEAYIELNDAVEKAEAEAESREQIADAEALDADFGHRHVYK